MGLPDPIPGADHFTIFNCDRLKLEKEVDVITTYGNPFGAWPINELCLSPDGRHLVGLGLDEGQLFDYDLKAEEFSRLINFNGFWTGPRSLTCQTQR
jgi:hypothetical protein